MAGRGPIDSNDSLVAQFGRKGYTYEEGTTARTGHYTMIDVITAATFSTLTVAGADGDTQTSVSFPAGDKIYGDITAFTLSAGSVRAYKA